MTSPVIQFKRGAFANLPGLQAGEPALTTDTFEFYVGIDSTTNGNKFFGSHRYWTREGTSTGSGVNLVEGSSNGSNFITLKAPDTLAGIATYTFPATPTDGYFLKTNSSGELSWDAVVSTFDIAADSGSTDTVSTGSTITFAGGTNVNTAVTDDTITINLDDNISISSLSVSGIATLSGNTTLGDDGSDLITVVGVTTFTTSNVYIDNQLFVGGLQVSGGAVIGQDVETRHLSVSGITTLGSGVGVTQFSGSVSTGTSASSVPTSSAVIDYVTNEISGIDLEFGLAADTGTASTVDTSQTLTISGTANEVETAVSGQTVTVGLPDNVIVGASLTVTTALTTPTVNATNLRANDGTTAITITDASGAVGLSSDLTVGGNLYVNGSTTQVNTTSLTVEDRTIDLGKVSGTAPSSATTWDLGVLFNYHDGVGAKKSAVIWESDDAGKSNISIFKFATVLGADTDGTDANTPQLSVTTYAPIEIGALWVNDCAGASQVISCADGVRKLENITIDAGEF